MDQLRAECAEEKYLKHVLHSLGNRSGRLCAEVASDVPLQVAATEQTTVKILQHVPFCCGQQSQNCNKHKKLPKRSIKHPHHDATICLLEPARHTPTCDGRRQPRFIVDCANIQIHWPGEAHASKNPEHVS